MPVQYSDKIFEKLDNMPEFCSEFILNFGKENNYNTQLEYTRDINLFLSFLINQVDSLKGKNKKQVTLDDMNKITPLIINKYITYLEGSNRKPATIKRKRASISALYSYFWHAGILTNNPVLSSKKVVLPENEIIYLTIEEQNKLLSTIRYGTNLSKGAQARHNKYELRDVALFTLLLDTGIRLSELVNIDIIDFDLEKCSVLVTRKGGNHEEVFFSDECCTYLTEYIQEKQLFIPSLNLYEPMFTSTTGRRLTPRAIEKLTKKYVEAALPSKTKIICVHKLRSSFAMTLYRASNHDLLLVQKRMGHKSITTTQIYAKAEKEEIKNSRNLLQNARN